MPFPSKGCDTCRARHVKVVSVFSMTSDVTDNCSSSAMKQDQFALSALNQVESVAASTLSQVVWSFATKMSMQATKI
jgi:hypothetical protein